MLLRLAITRPEGIVYAAIAGFFRLVMAIQKKKLETDWLVARLLLDSIRCIPDVAMELHWVGWPNTYYAKLDGENRFKPFRFGSGGWLYSTVIFEPYWIAYLLPLYAIGLATLKDRRRYFVLAITLLGTILICWNGKASGFIIPFSGDKLPEFWTPIQSTGTTEGSFSS